MPPRVLSHPKRRGEWVELQFMARAAAHGLVVSKPWGDTARYDFVVESDGKFHRVQVKSTMAPHGKGYLCNAHTMGPDNRTVLRYDRSQIDFFAFFVVPEDLWYIVPVEASERRRSAILNPRNTKNRYWRYLEAWHLLAGNVKGTTNVRRQLE